MQEIAEAIQIGAKAYLNSQYKTIAIVGIFVLAIVSYFFNYLVGLGYFMGSIFIRSSWICRNANICRRLMLEQQKHQEKVYKLVLTMAFKSGAITGLLVAGLALLSITIYYIILIEFKC